MRYALDKEQLQLQELVRRVARERVPSRADDIDRSAQYPINRYMREAKVLQTVEGTSQIQRTSSAAACWVAARGHERIESVSSTPGRRQIGWNGHGNS